jgi:uncharacterized protein
MDTTAQPPQSPEQHPTEPATTTSTPPRLGWVEIAVGVVGYLLLTGLMIPVLPALARGLSSGPAVGITSAVAAIGAAALALAVRVRSPQALGLRRTSIRTVLLGVAAGVGARIVASLVAAAYAALTHQRTNPQAADFVTHGPVSVVVLVATTIVLVPFGEELLFRGVVFGALRRYGAPIAIGVSAVVFAIAHVSVALFAPILVLGLVNAGLYERTRTIWTPVACHITFNLLAFVLAVAFGR